LSERLYLPENPVNSKTLSYLTISGRLPAAAAAGILIVLMLAAYAGSFGASFHFDDFHQIVDNQNIRTLSSIPRFFRDAGLASSYQDKGYRPLTFSSYALNYAFSGYRVGGYHAVNLFFHFLNSLLVFVLAGRVMRRNGTGPGLAPFFIMLAFALHPIQTGAVTYISGRAVLLCSLFTLLSVLSFIRYRDEGRPGFAWAAAFFFLLGLLSKETAVACLGLMFAYDVSAPGGPAAALKKPSVYVGFCAVLAIFSWIKMALTGFVTLPRAAYPEGVYLLSEAKAALMYVRLMILPYGQNADYNMRPTSAPDVQTVIALAALCTIAASVWYIGKRDRAGLFFGLWFFLSALPESVVPLPDIAAEYRMYLPSVGFIGLVAVAARLIVRDGRIRSAVAAVVVLAMCVCTVSRNRVWADEMTLWTDVASKSPASARARLSLGMAYMRVERYPEAESEFKKALEVDPAFEKKFDAYNDLGICYIAMGRNSDAVVMLKTALSIAPADIDAYANLGLAYNRSGQYAESAAVLRDAVRLSPGNVLARENLASSLLMLGQNSDAVREMERAFGLSPMDFERGYRLAVMYVRAGMRDRALAQTRAIIPLAAGPEQTARVRNLAAELGGA